MKILVQWDYESGWTRDDYPKEHTPEKWAEFGAPDMAANYGSIRVSWLRWNLIRWLRRLAARLERGIKFPPHPWGRD